MKLLSWIRTIKQSGLVQSKEFKGDFCCLRAQVSSTEVQDIRTNSFSFYGPSHDPMFDETDEELMFDEDGFSGFLAIGTLGRDPETPRFTASVEEEEEEEDVITGAHKELAKLITEKLAKFPEEDSSCSKLVESSSPEGVKKRKGLLTNLFRRRKTVEGECYSMEKHGKRDFITRMLKKLSGSSSKTRNDDYIHKKKDLKKNVQIFQNKVHPVLCTPARDDDEIRSCTNRSSLKIHRLSSILEPNRKRENWIKTDAEYLVLEL